MDDSGRVHERASVTIARWSLGAATAALVALASGATALLVVTSTARVGLPVEDPHPLPATTADGSSGSADVLLLPGGSKAGTGTRAGRADDGSDPLLVLRRAGTRSGAALPGLAARESSADPSAPTSALVPPSADGAPEGGGSVAPDEGEQPATEGPETGGPETDRPETQRPETERPQRPARPIPAPGEGGGGDGAPPAEEEPEEREPAKNDGRTPAAEPRPQPPADGDEDEDEDDEDEDGSKGKGKDKKKEKGDEEERRDRDDARDDRARPEKDDEREDQEDDRPQHVGGGR